MDDPLAVRVVHEAETWLGTPYAHQMSVKGQGVDCLGLVRGVWRGLYGEEPVAVPPYPPDWFIHGEGDALMHAARQYLLPAKATAMGQVVLFRMIAGSSARHCGITMSSATFIHAWWGRSVTISRMGPWWQRRLVGRFTFPNPA